MLSLRKRVKSKVKNLIANLTTNICVKELKSFTYWCKVHNSAFQITSLSSFLCYTVFQIVFREELIYCAHARPQFFFGVFMDIVWRLKQTEYNIMLKYLLQRRKFVMNCQFLNDIKTCFPILCGHIQQQCCNCICEQRLAGTGCMSQMCLG